jgi:galactokinase
MLSTLHSRFYETFGAAPTLVVRAPGRVNLIGEHTDYNDGFVMPLAIDRACWIAARPRDDRHITVVSENFSQAGRVTFSLDNITKAPAPADWSNYTRGVAHILQTAGHTLRGMDALIWSDVPIGAGLSSSAAIEVASAYTLLQIANHQLPISNIQLARLAQRAEVEFVGVNCGIMDQMISALGQEGYALLIDCRSLDSQAVPIPDDVAIVVADTMKRRELVDSKYNERRAECEEGARLLGVKSLRDVSLMEFETNQSRLPETIRRRCRHVIGENERVLRCVEALRVGKLAEIGQLLVQSHTSLRDDYAVSCRELDEMVECALRQQGVVGARMTGAGFGGCTVNVVRGADAETFARNLSTMYQQTVGISPKVYVCKASQGVSVL